jgi:S1-C subfamily serine protease
MVRRPVLFLPEPMNLSFKQLATYMSLLAIGSGAGMIGSQYWLKSQQNDASPMQEAPALLKPLANHPKPSVMAALPQTSNPNFIAQAVERVGAAVVRIDSARRVTNDLPDAFKNPFFRRFFGDDAPPERERVERGTGSGFILAADGRILTNAHVVSGTDTVEVTLRDGRTFEGRVVGSDAVTDVAVVKIEAKGLPKVTISASENLAPGQWAIAIGNP